MKTPLTFLNYAFPPGHLVLFKDSGANTFRSEVAILRVVQDPLSHGRCVVISSGHDHILNWVRWNSRTPWLLSNKEYFTDAAYRELSHCRLEASEEEFASCSRQSGTSPDCRTEFEASDFFLSSFFFQLCLSVFLSLKKMTQKFPQSSNWYAWDGPSLSGRRRHWECVLEAWTRRQGSLGEGGRNAIALKTWWKQRLMAVHTSLVLWVPTMNAGSCFWLTSLIHHCVTWISHLNTFTLPYPSHLPHPNKRFMKGGYILFTKHAIG